MSVLPVEPAYRLAERAEEHRWLVTGLWSEQAVGIVGGEPKCCKSFLALDLAVSVASGTPCLRRFVVPKAGRVLLYAAEDALHIVRRRLDGIAVAAGARLADLNIQVITAPTLRLDLEADRRNLAETVDRLRHEDRDDHGRIYREIPLRVDLTRSPLAPRRVAPGASCP